MTSPTSPTSHFDQRRGRLARNRWTTPGRRSDARLKVIAGHVSNRFAMSVENSSWKTTVAQSLFRDLASVGNNASKVAGQPAAFGREHQAEIDVWKCLNEPRGRNLVTVRGYEDSPIDFSGQGIRDQGDRNGNIRLLFFLELAAISGFRTDSRRRFEVRFVHDYIHRAKSGEIVAVPLLLVVVPIEHGGEEVHSIEALARTQKRFGQSPHIDPLQLMIAERINRVIHIERVYVNFSRASATEVDFSNFRA